MITISKTFLAGTLLSLLALCSCGKDDATAPAPEANVVTASGDLSSALGQFRSLLGDSLNTTPGKTSGRREVNWDGVPAALNNNEAFPVDFFNATDATAPNGRKRGLVYVNDGTTLRVDSSDFAGIDASYADQFNAFSGKRSFSAGNSHVSQLVFNLAGTTTPAAVRGFGLVFSDVDLAGATTVECFDGDRSLGVFAAPVAGANSFSFLGIHFPDQFITKVKITAGNARLAPGVKDVSNGGQYDLVVMDDFFYSEPVLR